MSSPAKRRVSVTSTTGAVAPQSAPCSAAAAAVRSSGAAGGAAGRVAAGALGACSGARALSAPSHACAELSVLPRAVPLPRTHRPRRARRSRRWDAAGTRCRRRGDGGEQAGALAGGRHSRAALEPLPRLLRCSRGRDALVNAAVTALEAGSARLGGLLLPCRHWLAVTRSWGKATRAPWRRPRRLGRARGVLFKTRRRINNRCEVSRRKEFFWLASQRLTREASGVAHLICLPTAARGTPAVRAAAAQVQVQARAAGGTAPARVAWEASCTAPAQTRASRGR